MSIALRLAPLSLLLAAPTMAQDGANDFASGSDIAARVEAMGKAMKPGQGFAWEPVVRDGERVAALEYWKTPGRPAVHPDQAEYAIVIAGAGTLRTGKTMEGGRRTQPGLVEGDRIVDPVDRPLKPGDVLCEVPKSSVLWRPW